MLSDLGQEVMRLEAIIGGQTSASLPQTLPPRRRRTILTGMASSITLTLNGESRIFEGPTDGPLSVSALLIVLGLDTKKVAVERNEEIVPRSRYAETWLASGDSLEIVHFIGGG